VNRDRILARIRDLRPWYHNVPLGEGITTKDLSDPNNFHAGEDVPTMLWKHIEPFFPPDLRGKRALDIGCNAGFFSFELRRRGATVLGIDIDQSAQTPFITQAEFCREVLGLDRIEFRRQSLLDLPDSERFDFVLFLGVFYHIPNFCTALQKLAAILSPGGGMLLETQIAPRSLTCYENVSFRGDPGTTFFVPSVPVMQALLRDYEFVIRRELTISEERYACLSVRP